MTESNEHQFKWVRVREGKFTREENQGSEEEEKEGKRKYHETGNEWESKLQT